MHGYLSHGSLLYGRYMIQIQHRGRCEASLFVANNNKKGMFVWPPNTAPAPLLHLTSYSVCAIDFGSQMYKVFWGRKKIFFSSNCLFLCVATPYSVCPIVLRTPRGTESLLHNVATT